MAVSNVSQREIVEVPYQLPDGSIKPHMALVLSTDVVNIVDIIMYGATEDDVSIADVNGDGVVNAADIVEIVNIIMKQ